MVCSINLNKCRSLGVENRVPSSCVRDICIIRWIYPRLFSPPPASLIPLAIRNSVSPPNEVLIGSSATRFVHLRTPLRNARIEDEYNSVQCE